MWGFNLGQVNWRPKRKKKRGLNPLLKGFNLVWLPIGIYNKVRGHLWGFKCGGWVKKMHGQRPLMGLQIWWVHPQRSDATLEALVIWWSVGGGGLRNIQSHTHSQ